MKTFYFRFRPVAVVLKIFGVFPIQNVTSLDTSDLRFQFFSFSNFYSLIIFCLYGAMIYYFSFLLYYIPTRQPYLLFVVCLMIARSIVSFLFCYSKYRKLPKLIRLLDTFDQKKCGILTPSTRKNMVVWSITSNLIAMIGLLFSSYQSFELISTILPPGVDKSKIGLIASSFFTFLTTWQLYPSFLYIYFSIIIKFNFKEINKTLKHRNFTHDYFKSGVKKYDSDMHQMLSNIRYFHNMLSECVDELGKCYGTYIATDNFCMIIIFVFNISVYLYKSNRDTHLLMLTVGYAIILLNMILRSEDLKESGSKVINLLHGIPSAEISEKCQAEINIFLTQLIARPIQVSAAGYFVFDKTHTLAIMSAVATYLIVVVQFEQTPTSCDMTNETVLEH